MPFVYNNSNKLAISQTFLGLQAYSLHNQWENITDQVLELESVAVTDKVSFDIVKIWPILDREECVA